MDSARSAAFTLALTGDVMLGRGVDVALRRHGADYPWGDLLPALAAAELTVVNLECVISAAGEPWRRWPKVFHFHAGPLALEAPQQPALADASPPPGGPWGGGAADADRPSGPWGPEPTPGAPEPSGPWGPEPGPPSGGPWGPRQN